MITDNRLNVLGTAEELVAMPRAISRDTAWNLGTRIFFIQSEAGFPLVEGEEGSVDFEGTLKQLTEGGTDRKPISPLKAWMQAGVAAASISAAHEVDTAEIVLPEKELQLREALSAMALRDADQAALAETAA